MNRHVVILGLMGSGKTSLGRALAERLDRPYRDSDTDIEQLTGRSGRDIAATDGVDHLHQLEAAVLLDALRSDERCVVTAAGWTIEDGTCVDTIRGSAYVIWLDAPADVLAARMQAGDHRRPMDVAEIATLGARRTPLFRQAADLALDATTDLNALVNAVLDDLDPPPPSSCAQPSDTL